MGPELAAALTGNEREGRDKKKKKGIETKGFRGRTDAVMKDHVTANPFGPGTFLSDQMSCLGLGMIPKKKDSLPQYSNAL